MTCRSRAAAQAALAVAARILEKLGVTLHEGVLIAGLYSVSGRIVTNGGDALVGKPVPEKKLYGEIGLVNLVSLIPSLKPQNRSTLVKAGCGRTARPV